MPDFGFGFFLLKRKVAPEFKNSGATFSTTLYIFKECTYFETKVEDGLSDSRKAGCRRSGGFVAQEPRLAEDICTSQDTVSGTFLYFCVLT